MSKRKKPALSLAPPAPEEASTPVTSKVTASAPPPQPQPNQETANPQAAAAETARQQAWDLSAEPSFGDLALLPWSHERHTLCARLIAADLPALPLRELERIQAMVAGTKELQDVSLSRYVDLTPYLPTAEKVLFLAAHEPHEFSAYRSSMSRFFAEIAAWSQQHISRDQMELACLTAHQILTQHEGVQAMHAPRRGGKGSLGN